MSDSAPHETRPKSRWQKSRVEKPCSKCGEENDRKAQGYCSFCHSAYMRQWRKDHPHSNTRKRSTSVPCDISGNKEAA